MIKSLFGNVHTSWSSIGGDDDDSGNFGLHVRRRRMMPGLAVGRGREKILFCLMYL